MVDKSNLAILAACSLIIILIDLALTWYLLKTKRRMEALPARGISAKALITGYERDKEDRLDIVLYRFETAEGEKFDGRQMLTPETGVATYPLEGAVDVLYLQKQPQINCLKNHVDTKLGIARNIGIVVRILPISVIVILCILWFCFYKSRGA